MVGLSAFVIRVTSCFAVDKCELNAREVEFFCPLIVFDSQGAENASWLGLQSRWLSIWVADGFQFERVEASTVFTQEDGNGMLSSIQRHFDRICPIAI